MHNISAASPRNTYGSPPDARTKRELLSLSASMEELPPDTLLKKTPSRPPVSFLNPTPSSALRHRHARTTGPSQQGGPDYLPSEYGHQGQQAFSSSSHYTGRDHGNSSFNPSARYNSINQSSFAQDRGQRSFHAAPRRSASGGYEVTVFGFPPDKTNVIINRFQRYGEIIDKKNGSGNWVHITYKNSKGHENALHKNGYIIDGVMVGVKERNPDDDAGHQAKQRFGSSHAQNSILSGMSRTGISSMTQQDKSMGLHSRFTEPTLKRRDIYASGGGLHRKKSFCDTLTQYLLNW
jgi:hypothetical protein